MNDSTDLDIVEVILRACCDAGLAPEIALCIENSVRIQFGGQRVRIPKKQKHLTPELRQAAFKDGLTSAPDSVITAKYKISRATLHRLMKTGG